MKDYSLHLLDILENPVKAGATKVILSISHTGNLLTFLVKDNGPGLTPEISADPADPFATTRKERKVGMGLSLLKMAAEQTGGSFMIGNLKEGGTRLETVFDISHIDAKPLGDLPQAIATAVMSWPAVDFLVQTGNDNQIVLDTVAINAELDGVSLGDPRIQHFLVEQLKSQFQGLFQWVNQVSSSITLGSDTS